MCGGDFKTIVSDLRTQLSGRLLTSMFGTLGSTPGSTRNEKEKAPNKQKNDMLETIFYLMAAEFTADSF